MNNRRPDVTEPVGSDDLKLGPKSGPKADSIVTTAAGTYCFGLFEMAQAMFGIRIPTGAELPEKFLLAVEPDSISRHPSTCGKYEFVLAVRLHCSEWFMPEETLERQRQVQQNWNAINYGKLQNLGA